MSAGWMAGTTVVLSAALMADSMAEHLERKMVERSEDWTASNWAESSDRRWAEWRAARMASMWGLQSVEALVAPLAGHWVDQSAVCWAVRTARTMAEHWG